MLGAALLGALLLRPKEDMCRHAAQHISVDSSCTYSGKSIGRCDFPAQAESSMKSGHDLSIDHINAM